MAPPKFADLSKSVSDLFKDDFGPGEVKVTLKAKASNGLNLKVEGKQATKSGDIDGLLESKYESSGYSIKEKWTTKNEITTELTATDKFVQGAKGIAELKFSPNTGLQDHKLEGEFKRDAYLASAVYGKSGFTVSGVAQVFGKVFVAAKLDIPSSKPAKVYELAAAYKLEDLEIVGNVKDGKDVSGSIFHVAGAVKTGVQFSWSQGSSDTTFAVAGSYKYDSDTDLKAKIDKNLALTLAIKNQLRPGITVGVSGQVNAGQLSGGASLFGLSLELSS